MAEGTCILPRSDSRGALRGDAPRSEGVRARRGRRPVRRRVRRHRRACARSSARCACLDTPISESAIIGVSIGASLRGYRPVAEMQFADFITCGFDQIVNQAATLRYRYGGRASVPDRRARAERRQRRRRAVSLAESRGVVRPSARAEGRGAVDGVGREGTAEGGDPRRQPGRSTSSTSISIAARRARCPRATRSCRSAWPPIAARGQRRHARDLRRDGDAVARGGRSAGEGRRRGRGDRSADADAVRQGARSSRRSRRRAACSIVHEDVKTLGIGAELSAVIMEERFDAPRRAGDARHLSRHALPVLARARSGQPAECRDRYGRAATPGGVLRESDRVFDRCRDAYRSSPQVRAASLTPGPPAGRRPPAGTRT